VLAEQELYLRVVLAATDLTHCLLLLRLQSEAAVVDHMQITVLQPVADPVAVVVAVQVVVFLVQVELLDKATVEVPVELLPGPVAVAVVQVQQV
jgi:hypothetical protein